MREIYVGARTAARQRTLCVVLVIEFTDVREVVLHLTVMRRHNLVRCV